MPIQIRQTTREAPPRVSFSKIASETLGAEYELSLVFCGAALARSLNRQYRLKDYAANVLSFPLSKNSGEVFICLSKARAECRKFGMGFEKYVAYLFIHGCLHLNGMEHGAKMEKTEQKLLHVSSHRRWY